MMPHIKELEHFNPTRLCTISRAGRELSVPQHNTLQLMEAYDSLLSQVRAILEDEWDFRREVQREAPQITILQSADMLSALSDDVVTTKTCEQALLLSARILIATRIAFRNDTESKVDISVDISGLLSQMRSSQGIASYADIVIHVVPGGVARAEFLPKKSIDVESFKQTNFSELPGNNVVVIGIGGGSDGCQAAQEALCMERAGKTVKGVFDVRRIKDCTPEKIEQLDRAIREQNAGERIGNTHAWRITKEIAGIESLFGSGRFMSHVPAGDVSMYLLLDNVDGVDTADTLKAALAHIGDVNAVYAADTGGDALFPLHAGEDLDISHTTPDQDAAVLQALYRVQQSPDNSMFFGSTIIAAGIDTPDDARERLQMAHATYINVMDSDAESVLEKYTEWDMTGDNPSRFGVTPFVWQMALRSEFGARSLPLPIQNIVNRKNPWSPFRVVLPGMNGIFVMPLEKHIQSISGT